MLPRAVATIRGSSPGSASRGEDVAPKLATKKTSSSVSIAMPCGSASSVSSPQSTQLGGASSRASFEYAATICSCCAVMSSSCASSSTARPNDPIGVRSFQAGDAFPRASRSQTVMCRSVSLLSE